MKISTLRFLTAGLILGLILVGSFGRAGWGTLCSLDLGFINLSCPLGFLQTSLASRSVTWGTLLSGGVVILGTILLARAFCAWICPTTLLRTIFKKRASDLVLLGEANGKERPRPIAKAQAGSPEPEKDRAIGLSVLGGSLLSSALFGFPVFCLVCPVGLTFGTLLAVKRLLFGMQPSFELVLFPLMLILEIFVLRKWCTRLCPLGALLGLLGSTRLRILKPTIRAEDCLATQGVNCQACRKACAQGIDLRQSGALSHGSAALSGCTNCLDCWKRCPTQAIQVVDLSGWKGLLKGRHSLRIVNKAQQSERSLKP